MANTTTNPDFVAAPQHSSARELTQEEFLSLKTKFAEPGNIIPSFWYHKIIDEKGRADITAITLLSEIFALYRFSSSSNPCAFISNPSCSSPTLVGRALRVPYEHFVKRFCISKEKARRAFIKLEELCLITRDVCNIALKKGGRQNFLLLTLDHEFFKSCFRDPKQDVRVRMDAEHRINKADNTEFAEGDKYTTINLAKEINEGVTEDNSNSKLNFRKNDQIEEGIYAEERLDGDKSPSIQICNHHIKKKNIIKNRSMKSNFKINDLKEKEKELEIEEILEPTKSNIPEEAGKEEVIRKKERKRWEKKTLTDYYPLTEEDCKILQKESGREFNLNAMNEILLDISGKMKSVSFWSKKGFMSYMSKIYSYEKRNEMLINNASFRIRTNMTKEEAKCQLIEQYLGKIESRTEVTPEMTLQRKLAVLLKPETAYEFLRAYSSGVLQGEKYVMYLRKHVELMEIEKEVITSQVQVVYGRLRVSEDCFFGTISGVEIKMPKKQTSKLPRASTGEEKKKEPELFKGIWGKVRRGLIECLGEDNDRNWFSNMSCKVDEAKKELTVITSSDFYKDWANRNFLPELKQVSKDCGFELVGISC
ncbi:MAG: hypothetical protein COA94_09255 [Rickettsiales bacterium]|nr:MAG: hypothetical protein COA94_09255 [Rickettsiales bacterium]